VPDQRDSRSPDEFEEYLDERSRNPAFRAALEDTWARKQLLARLVELRISRGVTQAEVAGRMQTTQSFVSEFENGGTDPQLSTLQRYARALDTQLNIVLDMAPGSPWHPADQGAYRQPGQTHLGSQTLPSPARDSGLAWREHARLTAHGQTGGGPVRVTT
jgi:transcriptional regulator with XRE-family HTH domain